MTRRGTNRDCWKTKYISINIQTEVVLSWRGSLGLQVELRQRISHRRDSSDLGSSRDSFFIVGTEDQGLEPKVPS